MAERADLAQARARVQQRAKTSLSGLSRLQGVELTSIINMIESEADGAAPLVDLDELGRGSGRVLMTPPSGTPSRDLRDSDLDIDMRQDRRADTGVPIRGDRLPARADSTPDPRSRSLPPTRKQGAYADRGGGRPFKIKAWMVFAAVAVIGFIVAVVVGMSGTEVEPAKDPPAPGSGSGSSGGSGSGTAR
jgi:hypothetical protein